MHKVICSVCGIQFDRDKIQAVKSSSRRYAHYECMPQGVIVPLPKKVEEEKELEQLKEYIKKLFEGNSSYNPVKINKQIKDFKNVNNYSYTGILRALVYFYNVKGNPIEKSYGGIGIVPYVYEEAQRYYLNLFNIQNANIKILEEQKEQSSNKIKVKEIKIKKPKSINRTVKLFNLD